MIERDFAMIDVEQRLTDILTVANENRDDIEQLKRDLLDLRNWLRNLNLDLNNLRTP